MSKNTIIGLGVGSYSASGPDMTGRVKRNLSLPHMKNAVSRCISLFELQANSASHNFADHFESYRSEWLSSVMSSAASGEAYVNEMIDRLGSDPDNDNWKKEPAHKKAKKFLMEGRQIKFDLGWRETKNFGQVLEVRNAIMHFKPKFDDENERSKGFEKDLPDLRQNSLVDKEAPFFPMRCISFEYSRWAVFSALDFIRTLDEKTGEGRYAKHFGVLEGQLGGLEGH